MPNWCNNNVEITGPTEKVTSIFKKAHSEDSGLLNALVPQPDNLFTGNLGEQERQDCEEQSIPNWYDWNVQNWGTKWDVDSEGLDLHDNGDGTSTISGWFDSAWAPPIDAYDSFLESNEDCSISALYEEGGMDFAGIYEDGDDQYMDDISDYCRAVVKGETALEDTPELFQKLDEEFELIEHRREYIEEEELA
jgi:hypothetical protein